MKSNEESNEELLNKIYWKNIKIHNNNKEKKNNGPKNEQEILCVFYFEESSFCLDWSTGKYKEVKNV